MKLSIKWLVIKQKSTPKMSSINSKNEKRRRRSVRWIMRALCVGPTGWLSMWKWKVIAVCTAYHTLTHTHTYPDVTANVSNKQPKLISFWLVGVGMSRHQKQSRRRSGRTTAIIIIKNRTERRKWFDFYYLKLIVDDIGDDATTSKMTSTMSSNISGSDSNNQQIYSE